MVGMPTAKTRSVRRMLIVLIIDGKPITSIDQTDFKTNEFIENITFEVTP